MNKNLLRAVMAKSGDTQKALSEYLDISEQALSSKIHEKNNKGFSQIEIKKIIQKYSLTEDEVYSIFFGNEVSNKDT